MRYAHPEELTDGAVHDYLVLYPSGSRLRLRGIFAVLALDGACSPAIRAGERLTVLGPRAVVTRNGLVIHDPRRVASLPAWVHSWLAQHSEWPRVATEATP